LSVKFVFDILFCEAVGQKQSDDERSNYKYQKTGVQNSLLMIKVSFEDIHAFTA
jgi:hypothetical protein